jgi:hypothetical protein
MTRLGLRSYDEGDEDLLKALRRIEPVLGDTAAYLESLPPDSFDAVYFDPMFEHPVEGSSNMVPMRPAADHRPLTRSVIEKALKAAPLVVVKERSRQFLTELGAQEIQGGRYSRIKYGIIRRIP